MSNPFELRFKLLEMAQNYLQDQQGREENFAYTAWELSKEQGNASMDFWKTLRAKSYTIADVKAKAEELYQFVEQDKLR